jgi:hypothetical protein
MSNANAGKAVYIQADEVRLTAAETCKSTGPHQEATTGAHQQEKLLSQTYKEKC